MWNCSRRALAVAFATAFAASALVTNDAAAQDKGAGKAKGSAPKPPKAAKADTGKDGKAKKPDVSKLWKSETPLEVTFTANFRQLRKEKNQNAPWHAATITYKDSAGGATTVPLRVRTRGIWRLANCEFPPLKLDFPDKATKQSLFDDLEEPKMVTYCKSGSNADEYVLQELQLYRIYRRLTPVAHETRLLRVTYTDSASGKPEFTRWAFLIEDTGRMAERVGGREIELKGATDEDLEPDQTALAFLYMYFVGNTDFSFNSLHNAELMALGTGRTVPVPYDFDFAGAINLPYAAPAPNLRIRNVRERQFRGYCSIRDAYTPAMELFKSRKDDIYALYGDSIGALISRPTARATLGYFDKFFEDIATPQTFMRRVYPDCVKGRV